MGHEKKGRPDRFALALGAARLASPYVGIPVVSQDRINAAWDERLGAKSGKARSGHEQARSRLGWAT